MKTKDMIVKIKDLFLITIILMLSLTIVVLLHKKEFKHPFKKNMHLFPPPPPSAKKMADELEKKLDLIEKMLDFTAEQKKLNYPLKKELVEFIRENLSSKNDLYNIISESIKKEELNKEDLFRDFEKDFLDKKESIKKFLDIFVRFHKILTTEQKEELYKKIKEHTERKFKMPK
jgi:hypothetical protein